MSTSSPSAHSVPAVAALRAVLLLGSPDEVTHALENGSPGNAASALATLPPRLAQAHLESIGDGLRRSIVAAAPADIAERWLSRASWPANTVGSLMRPLRGIVPAEAPVPAVVDYVRRVAHAELTYLYGVDMDGRVAGVVVLRDLFLAPPDRTLIEIMIRPAFFLTPEMTVLEAMRASVGRHYPAYPVCDADGTLLGLVRGYALFENQVVTITAQTGNLVGLRSQEHIGTSFVASLRMRLPWLALNLGLSLLSALVVLAFKQTLGRFVILAVFLSVIATQGRNSGAQTMALVLRGLTADDWNDRRLRGVLLKEALLGFTNGLLIGVIAAGAIFLEEWLTGGRHALLLGAVVFSAMGLGCLLSCIGGVFVPLGLRRFGFDPALAAGILLSNVNTVVCQALFLVLAVWWVG